MRYWRGIEDELVKNGCSVHTTKVGTVSSIKQRAEELHVYLSNNFKGQNINIIGHSMGGLDARYLISHIKDRPYTVKSLTTIATPHRGSSFMDWCRDKIGVGHMSRFVEKYYDDIVLSTYDSILHQNLVYEAKNNLFFRIVAPIDAPAFTNLTREYCERFNQLTIDDPNVYYSSYAAHSELNNFSVLSFAQRIINEREGMNDGMVSVESAKWGDFVGIVNGSHWDLVPPKLTIDAFNRFNRIDFYFTIVTRLANMGF